MSETETKEMNRHERIAEAFSKATDKNAATGLLLAAIENIAGMVCPGEEETIHIDSELDDLLEKLEQA